MKVQQIRSFGMILASLMLLVTLVGGSWGQVTAAEQSYVIPTFSIVSVVTDQTVTIQTYNFPANDTFNVTMNVMHTQGVGGYQVATQNSGSGGSQTWTYTIPSQLHGLYQISIRLQSPTSGYYAYNWFYNNTSGSIPDTGLPPGVIPTFSIVSVVTDKTVTIQTYNFPANDNFNVLMNYMGTQGKGGYQVATQNSGSGGSQTWTYNIPSQLYGQYKIAIRLQSPTSGYYAYNWFYNNTTGGSIPDTGLPSGVYPTFSITAVVHDKTVSIRTANLPANDTFNVTMNVMHTQGIGGYQVATINSGSGGTQDLTFNIPSQLYGQYQISIRLQSPTSGYYAYNWFYNNTYP